MHSKKTKFDIFINGKEVLFIVDVCAYKLHYLVPNKRSKLIDEYESSSLVLLIHASELIVSTLTLV